MSDQSHICEQFARIEKALAARPEAGRQTFVSHTRVDQHMSCVTTEDHWRLTADMPSSCGGRGDSPTPGMLGRAAVGSCLAMGYMLRAARQGIPIRSLEVDIEADEDNGGLFGTSSNPPGYLAVRYCVRVDCDLDPDALTAFLDECDAHSPWRDILTREVPCKRTIERVGD